MITSTSASFDCRIERTTLTNTAQLLVTLPSDHKSERLHLLLGKIVGREDVSDPDFLNHRIQGPLAIR